MSFSGQIASSWWDTKQKCLWEWYNLTFIFSIILRMWFFPTMVWCVWRHLYLADLRIGGLICPSPVSWPCFIFLLYTYDYLCFDLFCSWNIAAVWLIEVYHIIISTDEECGLLCTHQKFFNMTILVISPDLTHICNVMCIHCTMHIL